MLQETLLTVLRRKPTPENSIWYNGNTFSFLCDAEQTGGSFVLIHCLFRKGGEPPAHYHTREDETFYMLDGEISFHVGDKKFSATPGDCVFAPREIPHQFRLVSETARAILLLTPAGIETLFKEFSIPARTLELPPKTDTPLSREFFEKMDKRATELGLVWMPEF